MRIHLCFLHSYGWHDGLCVWFCLFICATHAVLLIHLCSKHSHDVFVSVSFIHIEDVTYLYVWNCSFICLTHVVLLIHLCSKHSHCIFMCVSFIHRDDLCVWYCSFICVVNTIFAYSCVFHLFIKMTYVCGTAHSFV